MSGYDTTIKEANRAASIARGADPGHQECDHCGRIPLAGEPIHAWCVDRHRTIALCDDCIVIPMTTKKVESRKMKNREETIEWLKRTWPKTEHPDWDRFVGNRPRSPREWRNESLRVLVNALGRIPADLAKSINRSYADGKISYIAVGDDLVLCDESRGFRDESRSLRPTAAVAESIRRAASTDVEIKILEHSLAPLKSVVKGDAAIRMSDADQSITYETGNERARVSRRRTHTPLQYAIDEALRAHEEHPGVIGVVDTYEIGIGCGEELWKHLVATGKENLLNRTRKVVLDDRLYEELIRSGAACDDIGKAVATKDTLYLSLSSPEIP